MSRPQPKVLLQYNDKNTNTLQVIAGEKVYAVYYKNSPINLKYIKSFQNIKYRKTSFINPGHAHNLANKLNKTFKTDLFKVVEL